MPPGAIDERTGKAIFGVPGPGSYAAPGIFNNLPSQQIQDRAGKHVFNTAPQCTIQGRTEAPKLEDEDAPGPSAFHPIHKRVDPDIKSAPFGSANREHESKRFISRCHVSGDATGAPGPGAYR